MKTFCHSTVNEQSSSISLKHTPKGAMLINQSRRSRHALQTKTLLVLQKQHPLVTRNSVAREVVTRPRCFYGSSICGGVAFDSLFDTLWTDDMNEGFSNI
jgi:hypothetical protein